MNGDHSGRAAATKATSPAGLGRMTKGDYEALAHFRYQLRRFLRFSEDVTHAQGITALQYLLLLQIKGFPGREWASIGELAERLQAKHHAVVALVSRCEAAGLVKRSAGRDDRRRVHVSLTRQGAECMAKLARLHRAEVLSLRGVLAGPDLAAALAVEQRRAAAARVSDALQRSGNAAVPGPGREARRGH
jgi:DNA-binding MarR family transcriptional regulator